MGSGPSAEELIWDIVPSAASFIFLVGASGSSSCDLRRPGNHADFQEQLAPHLFQLLFGLAIFIYQIKRSISSKALLFVGLILMSTCRITIFILDHKQEYYLPHLPQYDFLHWRSLRRLSHGPDPCRLRQLLIVEI